MHGLTGGGWKRKRPDQGREDEQHNGKLFTPCSFTTYRQDLPPRQPPTLHRMSSGSYFPGPVRAVEIPKKGGTRVLGIPNVVDRVAQTVRHGIGAGSGEGLSRRLLRISSRTVALGRDSGMPQTVLGEGLDRRPRREGLLRHGLMGSTMKAVTGHTDQKWVLLYVERWLKAPMQMPDGTVIERTRGTPQGGPISPLLANLFLHYGFDLWISREIRSSGSSVSQTMR